LRLTYNALSKRADDAKALLNKAESAHHVANEINQAVSEGAKSALNNLLRARPLLKNTFIRGGLWGGETGVEWEHSGTPPSGGSDFSPALDVVQHLSSMMKNSQIKIHLVVASDGDVNDLTKSTEGLQQILADHKNITFDVLLMTPYKNTQMHELVESLQKSFPRRVSLKEAAKVVSFMEAVADRLNPSKAKKALVPKNG